MSKCTYIDGIGSSTALDTAGEMVDLKGLDCSSLVGGPFNWEHNSSTPETIVGKILKIKKIFEESDCEDDRQRMYWNSCKCPFLYVMGRLFDDKKDSAKEAAALFLDDHEHPHEVPMVGFSVEGSKINKTGMTVTHSIARKMTITNNPANKTCVAKMIPSKEEGVDSLDSIFKSEDYTEIDIQKTIKEFEDLNKSNETLNPVNRNGKRIGKNKYGKDIHSLAHEGAYAHFSPEEHSDSVNTRHRVAEHKQDIKAGHTNLDKAENPKGLSLVGPHGTKIGQTRSKKDIFSNKRVGEYHDFGHEEHADAAAAHHQAAQTTKDLKAKQSHADKAGLHISRAKTLRGVATKKKTDIKDALAPKAPIKNPTPNSPNPKMHHPELSGKINPPGKNLKKAESLDSLNDISYSEETDEEKNPLMNRIEDKYFIPRDALDYLTQTIKENLAEGDIDTEVRYNTNRSIYMDNQDLDSLKDTLNGIKPRIKIRVRQYAPNNENWENTAFVEIKEKLENGESKKMRIRIMASDVEAFLEGQPLKISEDLVNINKDITKQLLENRIRLFNHLISMYGYKKQMELKYERRAYTNDKIRITIDENLRFHNFKDISEENSLAIRCTSGWVNILQLENQLTNNDFMILEIKYQEDMPKWVKKLLEHSNAKKVGFSKYASAMVCTIETHKSEGFVGKESVVRDDSMAKSMTAGSGMAAPSQLEGGAALAKESLDKKMKKSAWLARAEEAYGKWEKREEFRSFMQKKMPMLKSHEIDSIGKCLVLKKTLYDKIKKPRPQQTKKIR